MIIFFNDCIRIIYDGSIWSPNPARRLPRWHRSKKRKKKIKKKFNIPGYLVKVVIFHRLIDLFYNLLYSRLLLIFNLKGISLGSPSPINPTGLLESFFTYPWYWFDLLWWPCHLLHCFFVTVDRPNSILTSFVLHSLIGFYFFPWPSLLFLGILSLRRLLVAQPNFQR